MELLKVLIVDDDATLRISLKTLIAWREHGYQLIGDAADGAEALTICRQTRPDIVITDMKMPGMDGLAFLRALQAEGQRPYILVLSGYDDFQLVRSAMRLGATDYLLKLELEPCRLLESLSPARASAQSSQAIDPGVIQEQLLRDVISHFYLDSAQLSRQLEDAGITFIDDSVWCFLIKVDELYRFEEVSEEDYHTLIFSIRNIAEEIVNDCMQGYYTAGKTGELYIFACLKPEYVSMTELVQSTARRLHTMLHRYLDISCAVGIGRGDRMPDGLHQAARDAAQAVRRRFLADDATVFEWDSLRDQVPQEKGFINKLRSQLVNGLTTFDNSTVHQVLDETQKRIPHLSHDSALTLLIELYGGVREILDRYGQDAVAALPHAFRPIGSFVILRRTDEMQQWLQALKADLSAFLRAERPETGPGSVVASACTLIEKDFSKEISVQQIACELNLSPGYLSALMKKHTGRNFTEYVTHVRIERAKHLLQDTNEKIYSVALATGFADQYYFSRIFKRVTGVTPGDWRKGVRPEVDA